MWSRKFQYALRALMWLAQRPQGPVSVRAIAEGTAIPHKYLETILHELRGDGIVTSRKGPHGGYTLAEEIASITLFDVLTAVDQEVAESLNNRGDAVLESATITGLNDLIARRMTATTIADALDSHLTEKTILNYVI